MSVVTCLFVCVYRQQYIDRTFSNAGLSIHDYVRTQVRMCVSYTHMI